MVIYNHIDSPRPWESVRLSMALRRFPRCSIGATSETGTAWAEPQGWIHWPDKMAFIGHCCGITPSEPSNFQHFRCFECKSQNLPCAMGTCKIRLPPSMDPAANINI